MTVYSFLTIQKESMKLHKTQDIIRYKIIELDCLGGKKY